MIVVDASVVSAALTNNRGGIWARDILEQEDLRAPHHLYVEVAHSLRRAALTGALSVDRATRAHEDLLEFRFTLHPYEPLAQRVWELRQNVTPYDAWYVALAEALGVGLATLDRRLATAVGPRCSFVTPPQ